MPAVEQIERLSALRGLLAEKFPAPEAKPAGLLATGLSAFDEPEGGLRRGAVTELTGSASAGALFIDAILGTIQRERCFGALIDGHRSFDPQGTAPGKLRRLLWVACPEASVAIKAADLLLRDGNLSLVILDLHFMSPRELRRIPASTWHRFQRLVEPASAILVILTPRPVVEGARVRIVIRNRWDLRAQRQRRHALLGGLEVQVFARREFSGLLPLDAAATA
jgi:hypothetical protein